MQRLKWSSSPRFTCPKTVTGLILLSVAPLLGLPFLGSAQWGLAQEPQLPAQWLGEWSQPPLEHRPLQIVHGLTPGRVVTDSLAQILQSPSQQPSTDEGMAYYLRRGRGGIVCNVAFDQYLESEENWKTLAAGVEVCAKLGMPVWIYDEKGYPSGAAGGLVLRGHPELEALVLARDPQHSPEFFLRKAFEYTHASNNYHAMRRYVNLADDRATARFIEVTHKAYWKRLEPHFGKTIVAFFTDEPSLMAVDLGQIPEPARSRVPVEDPPDPNVQPLPTVPWSYDLEKVYRERWNEDLSTQTKSLFEGNSPDDRRIRRQFWSLIGDLVASRYFGAIREWCEQHWVASSGHNLHEESILHHVPLYGNGLKCIAQMHIPGLDMLSSNPEAAIHSGWLTAAMPLSGALLEGHRRVMTEVSDFAQKMSGSGPVTLQEMEATTAWQAAWGVTEFTLYYNPEDRSVEDNWQYGLFVGRLNSVLKGSLPVPEVALYYPIYDLWTEYLPVAGPLRQAEQPPKVREIVGSFVRLGQTLERRQIPFVLIDHEYLAKAQLEKGSLHVGNAQLKTIVLPSGVEIPQGVKEKLESLEVEGGRVLRDAPDRPIAANKVCELIDPAFRLESPNDRIVLGHFQRDGRQIVVLVNVSKSEYQGTLIARSGVARYELDPQTGQIAAAKGSATTGTSIRLAGYETRILVY